MATKRTPLAHGLKRLQPRLYAMILALLLATLAMLLVRNCSHTYNHPFAGGLPPKSGGDTLDVAIEISPLAYSLAQDTVTGLDYEMLRDFAAEHGRAVKFHPFAPLDYAIRGLSEGNFDIVVSALPATAELKKRLLLTDCVYLDRQVLVQRRHSAKFVDKPAQLAGDTVWIADGSPFAERLLNLGHEIGDTIYVRQQPGRTAEHLAMLISAGTIDRAVINAGMALRICAADTALDASTPVSFTQFQTWALDTIRGRDLQSQINAWLKTYRQTPRYQALHRKYLSGGIWARE